jgi:hypothetical protein
VDARSDPDPVSLPPTRFVAFVRRLATPLWRLVGVAAIIEVPRRKTGSWRRVSVIPIDLDGKVYVLAFGGITEWARDLRATRAGRFYRRRRSREFVAAEVEGDERDRVIAKYLAGSGPVRKDFNRNPDPSHHPTFRLDELA